MSFFFPRILECFECSSVLLPPYDCQECDFSSQEKVLLKKHLCGISDISEDNTFKCTKCSLRSHSCLVIFLHGRYCKNITDDAGEWCKCEQCDYKSKRRAEIRQHVFENHTTHVRVNWHKCDHCDYRSQYISDLKRHCCDLRQHESDKAITANEFDGCDFIAKARANLKNAMRKHSSDEAINWYKCDICNYKVKTKSGLKSHTLRKHTSGGCGFKAKTKLNLKQNIATKHTSDAAVSWFKCDRCYFKTKTKIYLKEHIIRKHTSTEAIIWYKCERCEYKAKLKADLTGHIARMHISDKVIINWYNCDRCDFKTKYRADLEEHISRQHT